MIVVSERNKPILVVALLAFAIGIGVAVVNGIRGELACGFDHNLCAVHGAPHRYVGRAFTANGVPNAHARIAFAFNSSNNGGGTTLTIKADAEGRYCLIWPLEQAYPYVESSGGKANGPPNAKVAQLTRFAKGPVIISPDGEQWNSFAEKYGFRPDWETGPVQSGAVFWGGDQGGGGGIFDAGPHVAVVGRTHCVTASPPWNHFDNATSNRRFLLIEFSALAAALIALVAGLARLVIRKAARPIALAALASGATSILLYALFWPGGL